MAGARMPWAVLGAALLACGPAKHPADAGAPDPRLLWPFDPPPDSELRASPRKAFATWFIFRYTYDNGPIDNDAYANWLNPAGACDADPFIKDKNDSGHTCDEIGGLFRERPLPRPPRPDADWKSKDLDLEVQRARTLGLDGFLYDITTPVEDYYFGQFKLMLDAVERVPDAGFSLMMMPEWSNEGFWAQRGPDGGFPNKAALKPLLLSYANRPGLFRLGNRLPFSAWVAFGIESDAVAAAWWRAFLDDLKKPPSSLDLQFVPSYVDWSKHAPAFTGVGEGIMDWAADTKSIDLKQWVIDGHKLAPIWVAPIRMQDVRPKALTYWESSNSQKLRDSWMAAIDGKADWVQLICWNDYTEAINFQPSTGVQWAVYDLSKYYLTWFKTGVQPTIVRDALYYFHRIHSISVQPDLTKQAMAFRKWNDEPEHDEIELVAFMTAPGTLEISLGDASHLFTISAEQLARDRGIVTVRTPLQPGTPRFRLWRGGKAIVDFSSAFRIRDNIVYQDPLYRSGGSLRAALSGQLDCKAICERGDTEACVACPSEPVWKVANPP